MLRSILLPFLAFAALRGAPDVQVIVRPDIRLAEVKREDAKQMAADAIRDLFIEKLGPDSSRRVQVVLRSVKQRNRSSEELLREPKKGGSETTVEIDLTTEDTTSTKLKGTAYASFFGTTDRHELSGAPSDKTVMIGVVNRQRLRAIAQAVWIAGGLQAATR